MFGRETKDELFELLGNSNNAGGVTQIGGGSGNTYKPTAPNGGYKDMYDTAGRPGRVPPRSPCAGKPPGSCGRGSNTNIDINMPDAPDSNIDTGMGIMGAAKTLGDIGANVFDNKPKGLEGLITNITSGGRDVESSRKKRRTVSELFGLNVGQSKYGATV